MDHDVASFKGKGETDANVDLVSKKVSSSSEMDPVTRGLLDELKVMLREGDINMEIWREQAAAVLRAAKETRKASVSVSVSLRYSCG